MMSFSLHEQRKYTRMCATYTLSLRGGYRIFQKGGLRPAIRKAGGGGVLSTSGPIRKAGVGRCCPPKAGYEKRRGVGGCSALQARYKKRGDGGERGAA